jgi:hypothetical protein
LSCSFLKKKKRAKKRANLILLGLAVTGRLAEAGGNVGHLVVRTAVDETREGLASLRGTKRASH